MRVQISRILPALMDEAQLDGKLTYWGRKVESASGTEIFLV